MTLYAAHVTSDPVEILIMRVDVEDSTPEYFTLYQLPGQMAGITQAALIDKLDRLGWDADEESTSEVDHGYTIVSVTPRDWSAILRHVTRVHDTARAEMDRQETARRDAIVDAHAELRSGSAVAAAAGISKGRVYQILENRSV